MKKVILYNGRGNFPVCWLWKTGCDHIEVLNSKSADWSWYFLLLDPLGCVWWMVTPIVFRYTLTLTLHKTPCWYMENGSWSSVGRPFRYGPITSIRKSWIKITLNIMCRLCLNHFVLWDTSALIGAFWWRGLKSEFVGKVHKNDAGFYQIQVLDRPTDFRSRWILSIVASQDIDVPKEWYWDYGIFCNFST